MAASKATRLLIVAMLLAIILQAQTQAADLSSLSYYVGRWRCTSGPPGGPLRVVDVTFAHDGPSMIHTTVLVHADRSHRAFSESQLTTWDAAHRRFVQLSLDSAGAWSVDHATPWSGRRERWIDVAVSAGTFGREELLRLDPSHYVVENFATIGARKPSFVSHCTRR